MVSLPRYANAACSVPWVGLAVLVIGDRSMLLSARGWQPHLAMSSSVQCFTAGIARGGGSGMRNRHDTQIRRALGQALSFARGRVRAYADPRAIQ